MAQMPTQLSGNPLDNVNPGIPPAMPADDGQVAADVSRAQHNAFVKLHAAKMQEPQTVQKLRFWAQHDNIASQLPDDVLSEISSKVYDGYKIDDDSRAEWKEVVEKSLKCAQQDKEIKQYPFANAANVKYPLLATAAMQFNARAYPAIVNGNNIIRSKVVGNDPDGSKAARGARVSSFMGHVFIDQMRSWEFDTDTLLSRLPIVGSEFKKVFNDTESSHAESVLISALNLIVNQNITSLATAPRITHKYELFRNEIVERQRDGRFLDTDVFGDQENAMDDESAIVFLEQHCFFDMDEDGYDEPWIVTISEKSRTLVRICACFDPNRIKFNQQRVLRIPRTDYFVHYRFLPDQKGGFYGIGFGKLLESLSAVIDTSLNQMLDAAHLQNAGGGFIGSGLNFDDEDITFEPGKYINVDAPGSTIKDAIVHNTFPGPSPVLFQLLGMMMDSAKQLTSVQDVMTGASQAAMAQPTTVMALIDQGLKVFTAIYKRIYVALMQEFRIVYKIIREHGDDNYYAIFNAAPIGIQQDFADDNWLVVPVSDPNEVTEMQRMARGQFLASLMTSPFASLLEPAEILRRVLASANIDDLQKLFAQPKPPTPGDQMQAAMMQAQIDKLKAETIHLTALAHAEGSRAGLNDAKAATEILKDPIAEINAQNAAINNAGATP